LVRELLPKAGQIAVNRRVSCLADGIEFFDKIQR